MRGSTRSSPISGLKLPLTFFYQRCLSLAFRVFDKRFSSCVLSRTVASRQAIPGRSFLQQIQQFTVDGGYSNLHETECWALHRAGYTIVASQLSPHIQCTHWPADSLTGSGLRSRCSATEFLCVLIPQFVVLPSEQNRKIFTNHKLCRRFSHSVSSSRF